MRTNTARPRLGTILIAAAIVASCDVGSALFTEEEIDSMYEITFSQEGSVLESGALLVPSKAVSIAVKGIQGAPEAASLELSLRAANGAEAAALSYATASVPAAAAVPAAARTGPVLVKSLDEDIPPFTLPEDLDQGYYTLSVSLKSSSGTTLSSYSRTFLLFAGTLAAPDLAVYPGTVATEETALLKLAGPVPEGLDPWIRWTINGKTQASGLSSARFDRLAWRAPSAIGVYVIRAELYPYQPPAETDVPPLVKAEIRLPLSAGTKASDPLASLSAWSWFSFDGNLADRGVRPRESEPRGAGTPYLETFATGFGYRLGGGSGVASDSSLLPTNRENGNLAPFSAIFLIAEPLERDGPRTGILQSVQGSNSSERITIGVEEGVPYVSFGTYRVAASSALSSSVTRLAVYLDPSKNPVPVRFYLDDQAAGEGWIRADLTAFRPGTSIIAGRNGYHAIYDEVRVLQGAYPAFRLAERALRGDSLAVASGFEGGSLDETLTTVGEVAATHGSLTLQAGSRLELGPAGLPEGGSTVSFKLLSGMAAAYLDLDDGTRLAVTADGRLFIDGKELGQALSMESGAGFSVTADIRDDGTAWYGTGEGRVLVSAFPAEDARWIIAPLNGESAAITNVSAWSLTPEARTALREQAVDDQDEGDVPDEPEAAVTALPGVQTAARIANPDE